MRPSDKSPEIRSMMADLVGADTEDRIRRNVCALCGKPATNFTDAISAREFSISGMCQKCQDGFFTGEEAL